MRVMFCGLGGGAEYTMHAGLTPMLHDQVMGWCVVRVLCVSTT
jgi:hypothetical protein